MNYVLIFLELNIPNAPLFGWVMWAVYATNIGYRRQVGNGKKILVREDNWLGRDNCKNKNTTGANMYDFYVICDGFFQHGCYFYPNCARFFQLSF
jgi:hypothetical protein